MTKRIMLFYVQSLPNLHVGIIAGGLLETVQEPLQGACMGLNASEEPVGHSRDLLECLPVQPARFIRSF